MPTKKPRNRIESFLVALAIFVSGCAVTSVAVGMVLRRVSLPVHPELAELRERYGPDKHSQFEEEWIIRDFFRDRRDGVFADIGASHYRDFSNTYYLETVLGWSGVAVEPLRQFEADYAKYRPRTRFLPFFVSDRSNEDAKVYFLEKSTRVTSADKNFTERYGAGAVEVSAKTITMDDLLSASNITELDFLSIDIELSEPKALAGFDIARFKPELVCIEAHYEVRQQILDYFARHGYVVIGKYLRGDAQNLYFAPLAAAGSGS